MAALRSALAVALAAVAATTAQADPVQWQVSNGGNGHYYLYVADAVTWEQALAAAAATSWQGMQGYLATVTGAGEDSFVAGASVANGSLAWIAASDDGAEGSWTWRAGPENGQALSYFNWAPGEPNNCCGGENYVHLNWGAGGSWNDHGGPGNPGQVNGYLVEFSAPVPEPTSAALLLLGGAALLGASRRRR